MPKGKSYRKKPYRKNYKKKTYKKKLILPRKIGFPKTQTFKLRYVTSFSLTSTSGSLAKGVIRSTSPYAPEISGGHSALGLDELSKYYNEYLVTGSRIKIEFLPTADTANAGICVGTYLNDNSAISAATWDALREQGRGRSKFILPNQDAKPTIMYNNYSCKGFWKVKDYGDVLADKGATMTGTPKDQAYFIIYAQPVDLISSTGVTAIITVDYAVRTFTPLELVQS